MSVGETDSARRVGVGPATQPGLKDKGGRAPRLLRRRLRCAVRRRRRGREMPQRKVQVCGKEQHVWTGFYMKDPVDPPPPPNGGICHLYYVSPVSLVPCWIREV